MRICIPADTSEGPTSFVSGHFGSAAWFHIVDLDSGATSVVRNAGRHHEHGACRPAQSLSGRGIAAVVCRGIGRNAERQLRNAGIAVYLCDALAVGDAVADARANRLRAVDAAHLCSGGHAHHDRSGQRSPDPTAP